MAAYSGVIVAGGLSSTMTQDLTFAGPVTIPANFTGFHNNGLGVGTTPTQVATATIVLNANKTLGVNMVSAGNGYYAGANGPTCAAVFSGGDPLTRQAAGSPIVNGATGQITGITITDNGDYQTTPPSVAIVNIGGPNIPACPPNMAAVRTHDYMGSFAYSALSGARADLANAYQYKTKWYGIDPGDGSGNYDWSALDQCILYHAAMGRSVLFTLYGTPKNYALYPTLTDLPYNNYAGGSSPLNAQGLTMGTPNVGLSGFITALVKRYNINANALTNPLTGAPFAAGARLINAIEVWNEPQFGANGAAIANASGYYWIGTAQQLANIAYIVRTTAKAIDPLIQIVGCGFAVFPMWPGTGTYMNFSNFLTATESISGNNNTGYSLVDAVSFHPYDMLEKGSAMGGAACSPIEFPIADMRRSMIAAGGALKPIIASEWGFFAAGSTFKTCNSTAIQAIQIKRVYATHALLGLAGSYGYSVDSVYLGKPTTDPLLYAALKSVNAINGKTITAVYRGKTGDIKLVFSDSTYWYTDSVSGQ